MVFAYGKANKSNLAQMQTMQIRNLAVVVGQQQVSGTHTHKSKNNNDNKTSE